MSGDANHGNAWPESVASVAMQEAEVGNKAHCTPYSNTDLTEHDYIGLSTPLICAPAIQTQSAFSPGTRPASDTHANNEEVEHRDTELRLGIGPVCKGDVSMAVMPSVTPANHGMLQRTSADIQLVKHVPSGVNVPSRPHEYVFNSSMEFHQSFWPWVAPGRFMIPVPKVSTVPAKRPYMEIVGESGDNKSSTGTLSTNPSAPTEAVSQFAAGPQLPMVASSSQGLYTWSHNNKSASYTQHGPCPNSTAIGRPSCASNTTFTNRGLPSPPVFKLPPTPPVGQYSSPAPPSTPSSTEALHQEAAKMSKAPVVGWPPVRTFRKNTLHSTVGLGANKAASASSDLPKQGDAVTNTSEAIGELNKGGGKDALFVKVKLDGVRICRKVDLSSYDNYDSLKSALQEMFQGFVCHENAKLDLLQRRNYVLTHEDKDGDWMLVGDVPWHMFVTTVKSFRIMKAADAVGLVQERKCLQS